MRSNIFEGKINIEFEGSDNKKCSGRTFGWGFKMEDLMKDFVGDLKFKEKIFRLANFFPQKCVKFEDKIFLLLKVGETYNFSLKI
jgi:hypothetical protein